MAVENGTAADQLSDQVKDLEVAGETAPDEAERSLLQKVIRKGLVENKNDIEVQRKDPKSPLYSVKSFEALNLKPSLLKGVYGKKSFLYELFFIFCSSNLIFWV